MHWEDNAKEVYEKINRYETERFMQSSCHLKLCAEVMLVNHLKSFCLELGEEGM